MKAKSKGGKPVVHLEGRIISICVAVVCHNVPGMPYPEEHWAKQRAMREAICPNGGMKESLKHSMSSYPELR